MLRAAGLLCASVLLTGCGALAPVVRYTDDLKDSGTGRTVFVRGPAQLGGLLGFIAGVPFDIAALPATYTIYKLEESRDPPTDVDPVTIFLFPSFVLWRAGILIAAPFDVLEYAVYRFWLPPKTLTEEEQRKLEDRIDAETLPRHPVEPLYPMPGMLPDPRADSRKSGPGASDGS